LFHNADFFGSCIILILYRGCAESKKKKIWRQRVKVHFQEYGNKEDTNYETNYTKRTKYFDIIKYKIVF